LKSLLNLKEDIGARVRLAPASTARVSSKEETQAWRRSLRGRNTTNVLIVKIWTGLGGVSQEDFVIMLLHAVSSGLLLFLSLF
jgi:hypothetical protein